MTRRSSWLASLAFFSLRSLCVFVIDRIWGERAEGWFEGFVAQIRLSSLNS
jgi:hypothetical protein